MDHFYVCSALVYFNFRIAVDTKIRRKIVFIGDSKNVGASASNTLNIIIIYRFFGVIYEYFPSELSERTTCVVLKSSSISLFYRKSRFNQKQFCCVLDLVGHFSIFLCSFLNHGEGVYSRNTRYVLKYFR